MSNELSNLHASLGFPAGEDAGLFEVADWAGDEMRTLLMKNAEMEAAWDSAEHNARRAEAAELEIKRLETENETLKKEYFLMRDLIDLCATRNDDGDYLDPEFAFEKAIEIQKAVRDLSA